VKFVNACNGCFFQKSVQVTIQKVEKNFEQKSSEYTTKIQTAMGETMRRFRVGWALRPENKGKSLLN